MFMNPFPMWFIIFVIIPINVLSAITYLPYFILKLIGLGRFYKRIHNLIWMNIEQFTLQPINYCRNIKSINVQIIEECNKL